jgi:hypothetical protein
VSLAQTWYYYVVGAAALAGILFAWYKLKPESTKIIVESAKVTVDMSDGLRDDMGRELRRVTDRLGVMEKRIDEADARAARAEAKAFRLEKQLTTEKARVHHLSKVVAALQQELTKHGIEIPPHLAAVDDI